MSAHLVLPTSFSTAKIFQDKFDVTLLHTKPEVAAQERMVDGGNGKVEVSRRGPHSASGTFPLQSRAACSHASFPLHFSLLSKRRGAGSLPTMLHGSEGHFPQWSITWRMPSSCR